MVVGSCEGSAERERETKGGEKQDTCNHAMQSRCHENTSMANNFSPKSCNAVQRTFNRLTTVGIDPVTV